MKKFWKKTAGKITILAAVLALLGTAVAVVLLNINKEPAPPEEETPGKWQYFWNVDRLEYDGKSETGMSSRPADKDDGYFHILFATEGRQVTRRVAEKRLVNIIDTNDLMGLEFDEKGIVIGMKPMSEISAGFEVQGLYLESVEEDGTLNLRSSSSLGGMQVQYKLPDGIRIFDVSGAVNFVGQEIQAKDLVARDRLFVVINLDGTITDAFVTSRYVRTPIYWNVVRKYDSTIAATTRTPNENKEYEFLMAVDGEQVTVKTKDRNIASSIDSQAAKCMALEFDQEGYVSRVISASKALGGASFGSWAHITSLVGDQIVAEKIIEAKDKGTVHNGVLAPNVRVFDVSGAGEFVGQEVFDLHVGDQIHAIANGQKQVEIIFIVGRTVDSPVYWSIDRKWDSTKKETTRKPGANGLYEFEVAVEGQNKKLYVTKELADKIDEQAAHCFGVKMKDGEIVDIVPAKSCTGAAGGPIASWYTVTSLKDSNNFHVFKTHTTSSEYGRNFDMQLTEKTKVINVSTNVKSHKGEYSKVGLGDMIHCLKDIDGTISYVFIITHPANVPLYWNAVRKYNSTTKQTTRTPEADGYYHIEFLVNGGTKVLRTKNKEFVQTIDAAAARLVGLEVSGDIITKVYGSTETYLTTGGSFCSWYDVTKVNSATSYHTLKDPKSTASDHGKEVDLVINSATKIYNVSGTYDDHPGELSNIRLNDRIHCLKDKDGNTSYVFIVSRTAPSVTKVCPECNAEVEFKSFNGSVSKSQDGKPVHLYLYGNRTLSSAISVPSSTEVHFDMNGKTFTGDDTRVFYFGGASATLRLFDLSSAKSGKITGTGLAATGGNDTGVLVSLGSSGNKVYAKDITIDGTGANRPGMSGLVYVPNGATLDLTRVKVLSGSMETGAAIYSTGRTNLTDTTVTGGTNVTGGSVVVGSTGTLYVNGNTLVSGGKRKDGTNANVFVTSGRVVNTTTGLTGGSIGIRAEESGIVATEKLGENSADKFVSDIAESPVTKRADNQLEIIYTVTGIRFEAASVTVPVGVPTELTATMQPANDPDVTIAYESSNPAVQILPDGKILVTAPLSAPATITAKTSDGEFTATVQVASTGTADGKHYHAEASNADILAGNGSKIVYEAWDSDTTLPTTSGYYYLTKDITFKTSQPMVPGNTDIHICLNGHTIVNGYANYAQTLCMFFEGSTFSLCDCSEGEKGVMKSEGTHTQLGRTMWVRFGTFNLYGGTIIGSDTTTSTGGGAINISTGATFNMFGGKVTGGSATRTGTSGGLGGNIYNSGTLNIYGGEISGGSARNGGNIYSVTGASTYIENAVVKDGKAELGGGNIGGYFQPLVIKNSEISNGTAGDAGGNLQILAGEFEMDNVKILGGTATSNLKAGIHMNCGATATINGLIKDTVVEKGILLQKAGTITLSGSTQIGNESEKTPIFVSNGSFVQELRAENLTADAKIVLNADNLGKVVTGGGAYIDNFVQVRSAQNALIASEGDLYLGSNHLHCLCGGELNGVGDHVCANTESPAMGWTPVATATDITNLVGIGEAAPEGGAEYFIYLTKNITLAASINVYTDVKLHICLNGFTLSGPQNSRVFHTFNGKPATITVSDCSETETGTIQCVGKLGDDTNALQGHAILLYNAGSVFELYGGTIKDGYAANHFGGNIGMGPGTIFRMYGGKIENGKVERVTTNTPYGGNIGATGSNSKIYIYDGEISGGSALNGGNIFGEGEVHILGGTIKDGTATRVNNGYGFGGNVYATNQVEIKNAVIEGGKAYTGGNIYCISPAVMTIEDSELKGGNASAGGGNIGGYYKPLTIKNTVISDGTAGDAGGNIQFAGGTFEFDKVQILGGKAGSDTKAGMHMNSGSSNTISGTMNDTLVEKGILLQKAEKITLSGDTRIGNETKKYALYISNNTFTQELVAKDLSETAKIVLNADKVAKVVTDGAAYKENFVQIKGAQYSLIAKDGNLHLASGHVHCLCGGNAEEVGDHVCDEDVTWTGVKTMADITNLVGIGEAITTASEEYYIFLENDITLTGTINLYTNVTLHICLNGHTLTGPNNSRVFSLYYGKPAKLTLSDCSEEETGVVQCVGKIGSSTSKLQGHAMLLYNTGTTFEMYGGTIKDGYAVNHFGGNIAMGAGTIVKLYGGTITGGKAEKVDSTSPFGGNIGANTNTKLYIYGGVVSDGTAVYGGNIYSDGEIYIEDGVISGGKAIKNGTAGGFGGNLACNGLITLKGGEIKDGIANGNQGGNIGLHAAKSKLVMEGGKITGGSCTTTNLSGGIACFYQATLADAVTIKGGEISGNKGGINIVTGGLVLSGDAIVDGNDNANITIGTSGTAKLGGDLTGGILSFSAAAGTKVLPSPTDFSAYLKNDNASITVMYDLAEQIHVFKN